MARLIFTTWMEFARYIRKFNPKRIYLYVTSDRTVVLRPSVQSKIDSAIYYRATEGQIQAMEDEMGKSGAENVFHVADVEWREDKCNQ